MSNGIEMTHAPLASAEEFELSLGQITQIGTGLRRLREEGRSTEETAEGSTT